MYNTLYHSGVKGMRWGYRKKQVESASSIVSESQKIQGAVSESKKTKKQRQAQKDTKPEIRNMTDDDLKRVVQRMNLEKQYSTLKSEQSSKGKSRLKSILDTSGTALVVANSAITIMMAMDKMNLDKKALAAVKK